MLFELHFLGIKKVSLKTSFHCKVISHFVPTKMNRIINEQEQDHYKKFTEVDWYGGKRHRKI